MPETMKAIVKTGRGPGRPYTELREVPKPKPRSGEALIKVLATAVCGTDKHIYGWDPSIQGRVAPPRVYGHEFCGTVEALGPRPGRTDVKPGTYVSAEMHVVCGQCPQCRIGAGHICRKTKILGLDGEGCFAQWVVVPCSNLIPLNAEVVPPRIGAFLDALGNAVHTTQMVDLSGKSVFVTGYGPIGAMCAAIAEFQGATRVYVLEIAEGGIKAAKQWIRSKKLRNITVFDAKRSSSEILTRCRDENNGGVDVLLETAGAPPAINLGLAALKAGGYASLLGLPSRRDLLLENYSGDVVFKGITLQGIIGRRMYGTWDKMLPLLEAGLDVDFLVTHEYNGLSKFHEAMDLLEKRKAMKVVFHPNAK
jgi:threonine 3-dehydrogenase